MSYRGNPGQQRGRGAGPGGGAGDRGGYRGGSPDGGRGGRGGPGGGRGYGDRGGFRGGSPGGSEGTRGGRGSPARGMGFPGSRGGGPRGGGPGGSTIFAEGTPANVPARLSAQAQDQLISSFKSLKIQPERPLRPGFGTAGRPITLRANFFAVKLPKGPIYDYRVEINPKTDINRLKARIFVLLEQSPLCKPHLGYIAHDRSQRLVSAQKLPQPLDVQVPYFEEGETGPRTGGKQPTVYTVSIIFDRELKTDQLTNYMDGRAEYRDYDPLPLISALNLVLQQHPAHNGVRVGKSKYFFPPSQAALGTGLEAWRGYYASVRPTYKQLMVNVNVCMTAFVAPGSLANALQAFSRNSRGAMPSLPKDFVKSIKVTTTHLGYRRRYPLKSVGTSSARNTFFECDAYGKISVEQYFKRQYNITLQHAADLPVVDIGSARRSNFLPAELCDIEPGQAFRGKLGDRETASMIKIACNPPRVNADHIVHEGFSKLGLAPLASPVNGFGVTIDTEMAVIPGRELLPPQLSYRSGGRLTVSNGSWNIMNVTFHKGAQVNSWWVLVIRDGQMFLKGKDDPRLQTLVMAFKNKLKKSGVTIPDSLPRLLISPELPPVHADPGRTNALAMIKKTLTDSLGVKGGQKPSFVLVLLSNRDNYIYPGIKRIGDVELGIQTIHMQLSKAIADERKQDQYLSNVALKVNTKLGGNNHLLDQTAMSWLMKKKTMIIGIDVTHPSPTSREGSPSIAAVVASVDDSFVQYPASLRIQKPDPGRESKETVTELGPMVLERLKHYEKKNKALPDRVMVFRDGVSEGQFDIVIREELPQIKEAFRRLNTKERKTPYNPKLSIIICGKRHNARFYPTTSQFADRNGNTQPGTVVDKGVTGVFDFDFYLQAHAGLQGTVKPTHYTVVYDESALSADEIQQGTHSSSYLYARATKAVSLMPAAYYADLACERGRYYLNDFLVDDTTSVAGSTSGRGRLDREEEKEKVFQAAKKAWGEGLHPDMRETMFYI